MHIPGPLRYPSTLWNGAESLLNDVVHDEVFVFGKAGTM